jgi:opacity protein-like surface antigen
VLIKLFTTAVPLAAVTMILAAAAEASSLPSSSAPSSDTAEIKTPALVTSPDSSGSSSAQKLSEKVSSAESTKVMTLREFQETVQGKAMHAEQSSEAAGVPNSLKQIASNSNPVSTEAAKLQGATAELSIAQNSTPQATSPKSQGFYLTTGTAISWRQRSGESSDTFTDFKTGFLINGALGYRFGDFRTDVEFTHFQHAVDAVSAAPTGLRPGDGKVRGNAFMLNLYYDFPIANSRFKPYVGAGVGTYSTRIKNLTNDTLQSFGLVVENEQSNNVFAYQLRAGLGYQVSDSVDVFLGYRYFHGNTITFSDTIFGTLKPNGAKLHNIEAGLRFLF